MARRDTYNAQWKKKSSVDMKQISADPSRFRILHNLFHRARDPQGMLDAPYHAQLLCRDYETKAALNEPFYATLFTILILRDRNTLHNRSLQCIWEQKIPNPQPASSSSGIDVYHMKQQDLENEEEFEQDYTLWAPFFKQK